MQTPVLGTKKCICAAAAILVVAVAVSIGCGAVPNGRAATAAPPDATATRSPSPTGATTAAPPTVSAGTGAAPSDSGSVTKQNQGGNVTVAVTWKNPSDATGSLTFSVVMDTHSVNLDGYDLSQLAVLRNERGQEVKAERWDAPSGGHHRSGTLAFPGKDGSGTPILGSGSKAVELVIRDVAGVNERVLRWELRG
jgi:hypothetical protein